jgi:hypothetical protein
VKAYTVRQVATMAGVSVRTLHHYDHIGLLAPSSRTDAGYRLYGEEDLLRLQQILWRGRAPGLHPHMARTLSQDPWLYPFEALRGLLWVALAVPVIRTTRGRAWEAGLLTALLFGLVMNDVHLLPNPLMPAPVRAIHFVETASSNFIWGWAIVWPLHRRQAAY